MKKLILGLIAFIMLIGFNGCGGLSPEKIAQYKSDCKARQQHEKFIFAYGECIDYYIANGKNNDEINVIIHGSWTPGSDPVRSKYKHWADYITKNTDITTIALNMPGYGASSSNYFTDLKWKKEVVPYANEEYFELVSRLIQNIKNKYNAKKINGIGQSAGANIFSSVAGYKPKLLNKVIMSAGEPYLNQWWSRRGKVNFNLSAIDYINKIDKNTKFLMVVGKEDKYGRYQSNKRFNKDLLNKGISSKVIAFDGINHNVDNETEMWDEVIKFILDK